MLPSPNRKEVARIENSALAVAVDARGIPTLFDKGSGTIWAPFADAQGAPLHLTGPGDQSILADLTTDCDVHVSAGSDQEIQVQYRSLRVNGQEWEFLLDVTISLGVPDTVATLTLSSLQLPPGLKLESLGYPGYQFSLRTTRDDGYLVVPMKQGIIVPTRFEVGYMRFQHNTWAKIADHEATLPFDTGSLNMPWYGAVRRNGDQQSAVLAYVETSADAALQVVCNKVVPTPALAQPEDPTTSGARLSTLTPVWRGSHGQLGYPRKLHLEVIPDGDHVRLAKRYRELAIANGRYRSLQDKIRENPRLERMVGAPDIKIYVYTDRLDEPYYRAGSEPVLSGYRCVHTTFDQVGDIAQQLHDECGIEHALVLLGGWIRAGYDREHPDVWPPAEPAGGVEGLRRASKRVTDLGYVLALHDNYQDMYPPAPSYSPDAIMRHPDGSLQHGHVWDGGPCDLMCSAEALSFARPVVEKVKKETQVNGYYLDTTTAARLYECYSTDHPLTRAQDREEKLGLLRWLSEQGFVVGGEAGTDWAVPVCGFFEGIPGSGRGFYDGLTGPAFGIGAPLFSLVYHDAVLCYWQHGQPFGREDHDHHVLHDLISGNPSSWVLVADQWEDLKPLIAEAAGLLGELHRRTAHEELASHRYLSVDFRVQESRFEGGIRVVTNSGITSADVGGEVIVPNGFLVEGPNGLHIKGVVHRHIEITEGGW